MKTLGIDIIVAHVGIDQQMEGKDSLALLKKLQGSLRIPIAVAGGLDCTGAADAVRLGAAIVIVGGGITRSADPEKSTAGIRAALDSPGVAAPGKPQKDQEIREIFDLVSSPNITDAMHRKGAMRGVVPLCRDVKMAGPAVTVQTFAGDWQSRSRRSMWHHPAMSS